MALNRPLSTSSRTPSRRTSWNVVSMRASSSFSRACARVTGMRWVISLTRAESSSTWCRNAALRSLMRLRITRISRAAAGTAIAKTGTNSGTRQAVRTSAPASVVRAAMPESKTWREVSTTFSTSRTTFACRTPALIRRW